MNFWVWDLSVHYTSTLRCCDNLCLMLALQNGNQHFFFDPAMWIGQKKKKKALKVISAHSQATFPLL